MAHSAYSPSFERLLDQNREKTVPGLNSSEQVLLAVRAHWASAMLAAWPAILSAVAFLAFTLLHTPNLALSALYRTAQLLTAILFLGALLRWIVAKGYEWWFTFYIITNQRIIYNKNTFTKESQEIHLVNIADATVQTNRIPEYLFRYGTVHARTVGGAEIHLLNIPFPYEVQSLLFEHIGTAKNAVAKPAPIIADPAMQEVINSITTDQATPEYQNIDPIIASHWPLSRFTNYHINRTEKLLGVVGKHWSYLLYLSLVPILIGLTAIVISGISAPLESRIPMYIAGILFIIAALWEIVIYLNFADDVWIITSERITDLERFYFVFFRSSFTIRFENFVKIETKSSLWGQLLGYGSLLIYANDDEDGKPSMALHNTPYPEQLKLEIDRIVTTFKAIHSANKANKQQSEIKDLFVTVLAEMLIAAPNFEGKTVLEAMEMAQSAGLHPLIAGEAVAYGTPAGLVISQIPSPGARALRGSNILFYISKMWDY